MYKTGKPNTAMVGVVLMGMSLLLLVLQRVVPLLSHRWNLMVSSFLRLWILIQRRRFIYIILNFIIISILISSTLTLYLNKLLVKLHKSKQKSEAKEKIQVDHGGVVQVPPDDNTWWCRIVNDEDDGIGRVYALLELDEAYRAVSFEAPEEDEKQEEEKNQVESRVEGEENDTIDATWEAILKAKRKASGSQLKVYEVWSSGVGGGGEHKKVEVALMQQEKLITDVGRVVGAKGGDEEEENATLEATWEAIMEAKRKAGGGGGSSGGDLQEVEREVVVDERESGGSGSGGGGGGGWGGWRRMEVMLMKHDKLKQRADAFIARVGNDMRLQRLESDQRFLEKINRGL